MLKTLILNRKRLPIPVPLLTVSDALKWVDRTFVVAPACITKALMNGREIRLDLPEDLSQKFLNSTQFEVVVESSLDLAIHCADVIHSMILVIEKSIKPLAVELLRNRDEMSLIKHCDQTRADVETIYELFQSLLPILEEHGLSAVVDQDEVLHLQFFLKRFRFKSQESRAAMPSLLLNQLEPILARLMTMVDRLQSALFSVVSEYTVAHRGSLPRQQQGSL